MLNRAFDLLKRQGGAALVQRIAGRVWRQKTYELYSLDCKLAPEPDREGERHQLHVLRKSDLVSAAGLLEQAAAINPETIEYFDDVRKDRVIGILAHDEGRLLHYAFVFKKNKTACLLGLPPGVALIGNAYTVPDARGRGIQGASVRVRAAVARDEGFSAIVAETAPDNLASQRGMLKGGMQPIGRLKLVVVMNCFVVRWQRPAGFRLLGFCW